MKANNLSSLGGALAGILLGLGCVSPSPVGAPAGSERGVDQQGIEPLSTFPDAKQALVRVPVPQTLGSGQPSEFSSTGTSSGSDERLAWQEPIVQRMNLTKEPAGVHWVVRSGWEFPDWTWDHESGRRIRVSLLSYSY